MKQQEIFGKKLKELRKKAGITQRQLAQIAQVDHTYISKLEAGSLLNVASGEAIKAFSQVLGDSAYLELLEAAGKCRHCEGTGNLGGRG